MTTKKSPGVGAGAGARRRKTESDNVYSSREQHLCQLVGELKELDDALKCIVDDAAWLDAYQKYLTISAALIQLKCQPDGAL